MLSLVDRFESLNMSPKNTHIEIQNYCLEHGLTQDLTDDLNSDVSLVRDELIRVGINPDMAENARWKFLEQFAGACANELIREMYK